MMRDLVKKVLERTDLAPDVYMSVDDMKRVSVRLDKELKYKTIDTYQLIPKEDGIISVRVVKGSRERLFSIYPEQLIDDPSYFIMREMEFFHLDTGVEIAKEFLSKCKGLYSYHVKGDEETNLIIIRYEILPGNMMIHKIPNDDRLEHCLELFCEEFK